MYSHDLTPFEKSMLKMMTDFFVASLGMSMAMTSFSAKLLSPPRKTHLTLVSSR